VKTRECFISNSSSSSFIINLSKLTEEQIQEILEPNYATQNCGADEGFPYKWSITIDRNANRIGGYTFMDNFDMMAYLDDIGVLSNIVEWGD